ncbi:MAG: FlgD immunoglobulin-like domain containing protein, partial [Fidelibacterota bacterium]
KLALAPDTVTVKSVTPDTLVALETGTFSGSVGQRGPGEGEGYGVLYDADRTVTRMYEQDLFTEKVTYTLPGPTLFRGLIRLKKGKFQGHFILPKDVNYATSDGRLAVYLYGEPGGELWEGLGVREGLVFSGGTTNPVDSKGPLISFGLPDRGLQWGDHVPEDADLIIQISDPLGVNVTEEVGHAIRLWLDENESDAVDLTDKFVYAPQSYTSGSLTYSLNGLPEGESLVTVEAWDNANNASQGTIALTLSSSKELTLTNVLNYPNPFRDGTQFAFELNQEARVTIKVFTLSGQLVKELDPMDVFLGYSHIDWDGRDDFGDRIANGAYLYQVTAAPLQEGKKATVIGKIAKYR